MTKETQTLVIYGKLQNTKDGRTWTKYITKDLNGKYYDVRFTAACLTKPSKVANYKLTLNVGDYWAKPNTNAAFNDILFIKNVVSIEEIHYEAQKIEF